MASNREPRHRSTRQDVNHIERWKKEYAHPRNRIRSRVILKWTIGSTKIGALVPHGLARLRGFRGFVRKEDEISLILGNRPRTAACRLPNLGERQNLMPPEAVEFVEMFLDSARPVPGSGVFHEVEDELFTGESGFPLVKGGPGISPVQRQPSEAKHIAVFGDPAAAIRGIDVTDKPQEAHQREERVSGDPPGAKRAVKLEAGTLLEEGLRSGRHAKLEVAVRRSDPDQRVKKRVRAHDVPAGPMSLNQPRLREARIKMGVRALDLDTSGFLDDPPHSPMLFSPEDGAVLRKAPFQVFRFSDVNQLVFLVVNEVDAGRVGK